MTEPKICPHCEQEMDEDLAELYVCSECGQKFTDCDIEEALEERLGTGEDSDDDEDEDDDTVYEKK